MQPAEASIVLPAPAPARLRRRALVVDDDPIARLALKSLLSHSGYEVMLAGDGCEALDSFQCTPADIIFMDMYMPRMDGLQAARGIKALSTSEFVPIVFLSATTETQDLVRCIEAGGDDFLTKPYDPVVLKAKIRALERIRAWHRASARVHARARADWEVAQSLLARAVMGDNPMTRALRVDLTPMDAFSADVFIAAYSPAGDMNLLLGDFTGHGLAAALAALPTAETLRSMTAKGFAPQQILLEINRKLRVQLPRGKFLAAAFVQVSPSLQRVWVANCGMPDVLVLGADGVRARVSSRALPLGVHDELDLGDCMHMVAVSRGERLLLVSDGVAEAVNAHGEQFGTARLERAAAQSNGDSIAAVKQALAMFRGDEPACDDVGVVEVELVPELFSASSASRRAGEVEASHSDASGQWRTAFELHADALRVTDPVPMLVSQLQQLPGMEQHRGALYTVLSELYSNALDHGVLGLNSSLKNEPDGFERYLDARERELATLSDGWVSIKAQCVRWSSGGQLTIEVEDSGEGFDWRAVSLGPTAAHLHGRGLHLVRGLCQTLSFEDPGNLVRAVYAWGSTAAESVQGRALSQ